MKNIGILTFIIWITLYSCIPAKSIETIIKGEIKGVSNSMVKLRKFEFDSDKILIIDSIFAKNDFFEFKINFNTSLCVDFYFENLNKQSRIVFLESGELVSIAGDVNTLKIDQFGKEVFDLQVKGAKSHDELLQKEKDIEANGNSLAYFEEIIKTNPKSLLTPVFILITRNNEHYFNGLGIKVKQSYYGEKVARRLENIERTSAGTKAIDFSCTDLNGQTLSLKDIQSKYIILDFWASWCKPCREGHPQLIQLYKKYKRSDLEIVGIALDKKDVDRWKRAIKEDAIDIWRHVLEECDSLNIPKSYNVQSIPTKIVLDSNGVIIKRFDSKPDTEFIIYIDSLLTEKNINNSGKEK